jgi:hypothetical protein
MERQYLSITFLLVAIALMANFTSASMPGGITDDEKSATPEFQAMLLPIMPEVRLRITAMSNGPVDEYEIVPISYKSQVVAGVNYFVKFTTGGSNPEYFHARIFRDLKRNLKLVKVVGPKKEEDPITYIP